MDQRFARMTQPGVQYMPESPLYPGGPSMEQILSGDEEAEDYMKWE
jgi:hypothetical protein